MAQATARPLNWLDSISGAAFGWPLIRRFGRGNRIIVPLCVVLIFGSFAASALLQMRLDRNHILSQSARFDQVRAKDLARAVGLMLDRYARMGAVFAANPEQYRSADLGRVEPGIHDIIVWDRNGSQLFRLDATATQILPPPVLNANRMIVPGGLVFRDKSRIVAVRFDSQTLIPSSLRAGLVPIGRATSLDAPVPGWPAAVEPPVGGQGSWDDWASMFPLYLFVILGPSLAGAWLSALLVGSFERQAKAMRAIRALKSTRPVEARLLIRLANAERGAMEALRCKSEFVAHMSHELRTPLNAVIGFAEIIAAGMYGAPGHPKYGEYAQDIAQAGKCLHAKIDDILEFANIEAGRFPLKDEPIEFAPAVSAILEEHQGRAFSRRISLSLAHGEPGQVRADPRALRRIVSNLLANALTYTIEGGIVRADIRFEEGAGVFTLSDSGPGFSPCEYQRLGAPFESFERRGTVTGQGLGIAIAMELARRMGGAMSLSGTSGHGATLELRLPRP